MQADKTTINDLSIFSRDEELSVLHRLDFTRTIGGRDWLYHLLNNPLSSITEIVATQQALQRIIDIHEQWPEKISNGTIMVMGRFYETALDIPAHSNPVNNLFFKILNSSDYSLTRYSVNHFIDFIQGLQQLVDLFSQAQHQAPLLSRLMERIKRMLQRTELQEILQYNKSKPLSIHKVLTYGYFFRHHFKQQTNELIDIYSKLDAYYSLAMACLKHQLNFPVLLEQEQPQLRADQLYHPLLATPVAYDIALTPQQNFLFLTGANMAGKSTFIKAVGVAVFLAHIGMGVPAKQMSLTLFDGLLSNIQVADNIAKGESYFFNEVQRIRKTIEKISDGKKWLILIDELFKGTNVQDAMKCSATVIEGLRKMKNALFILSTHLYEIGEGLRTYPNIQFRYFETLVQDDQLEFNYQLKEGISNDRLGYLILKNEGVVDMLQKL